MTEQQFLNELDTYLEKLSENERQVIRRDFIEYFEHGRSEGKSAKDIIESLGDIPELATEILAAYEEEEAEEALNAVAFHPTIDAQRLFQDVHVKANNVSLTIKAANITEPYVDVKDKDQHTEVDLSIKDNKLHVQINRKEKYFRILFITFITKTNSVDATLYLPIKQYNEIIVQNDNGLVKVKKLQFNTCQLHSDNGRVIVNKCAGTALNASSHNARVMVVKSSINHIVAMSHNGRVVTSDCEAEAISLKSSNGQIQCKYSSGDIEIFTSNSPVKIEMAQASGNMTVQTDNGSISVVTKEQLENCRLQLRSGVGSTSVYGTKTKSYTNGHETYTLKFTSHTGNIKVKQLETELVK